MITAPAWQRLFRADIIWFGAAAAVALSAGVVGDQLFRNPPLGLHYQTVAERMFTTSAPGVQPAQPINFVMADELEALLSRSDVITLDARPRIFYELGHLPRARSLSREQFDADFPPLESTLRVPGQTLLIYCSDAGCEDSALVAKALQERGLGPLLIYPGGYAEWEAAGNPVEVVP